MWVRDYKSAMPAEREGESFYDGSLGGKYTATILKNGIISVLFDYGEYTPGAAHPGWIIASVNYDIREHQVLALSSLFRSGSNYLGRLSRRAVADLEKRPFAYPPEIRQGAAPAQKNFKVFTLTDSALVLHFTEGQIAATVVSAQEQEVAIPLHDLAPILKKRFLETTAQSN